MNGLETPSPVMEGFSGVVDFDDVMKDPGNPSKLDSMFDSGDGLHPNTDGYKNMINAINDRTF